MPISLAASLFRGHRERLANRLALHPLDVLPQLQRRTASDCTLTLVSTVTASRAIVVPVVRTTARSIVFSSSRTLPGQ